MAAHEVRVTFAVLSESELLEPARAVPIGSLLMRPELGGSLAAIGAIRLARRTPSD